MKQLVKTRAETERESNWWKDELRRYYDNLDGNSGLFKLTGQIRMRESHFPEFTNVDGLNYGIQMRLQQESSY